MTDRSHRRRSGVWNGHKQQQYSDPDDAYDDGRRDNDWDARQDRQRRDPNLYDEWLSQEQRQDRPVQHDSSSRQRTVNRRPSLPLRQSSTTASGTTIRTVTPDDHQDDGYENNALTESTTMSFERVFIPHNSTTISASRRARDSPNSSSRTRNRDRDREAWSSQPSSPPSSRNGGGGGVNSSYVDHGQSRNGSYSGARRTRGVAENAAPELGKSWPHE